MKAGLLLPLLLVLTANSLRADPQITSWYTTYSTRYARIYESKTAQNSQANSTTWTGNTDGNQTVPVYSGVQGIVYSGSWVYIYSTGLASYVMGPWYLNTAKTQLFPNWPDNQRILYRFPRTSTIGTAPTTKTVNGGGTIGLMVDGVSMFNSWDAYYWSATSGTDVQATGTSNGEYWNRDAYVNEGVSFDPANAHQQNTGTYHYHADPLGLRYMLGDHVTYVSGSNYYAEAATTPTQHSPIIGWVADGYPMYGPYGYSTALSATSGIRRMVSGYTLRNGENGADDIVTTGRATIPAWAQRFYGASANQSGPAVSGSYPLGRYMEDNAFLGDLTNPGTGQTWVQGAGGYDLDEFNGRYCVTPDFPGGTYAYFVSISSSGTPIFPYDIGRAYYGSPVGGAVSAITDSGTTTVFSGAASVQEVADPPAVTGSNGDVTLTWSSVEGGTYKVQAAPDMEAWSTLSGSVAATANAIATAYVDVGAANSNARRFYEVTRTALATYDPVTIQGISSVAPTSGTAGDGVTLAITLNTDANPGPPPDSVDPSAVYLYNSSAGTSGSIGSSTYSRNSSTGVVTAFFSIPSNAPTGSYSVNVFFMGPAGTESLSNGFNVVAAPAVVTEAADRKASESARRDRR